MKKHVVVWTVIIVTACVFPLWAQGTAGSSDTLSRLLAEVHALRVAMERSASTGPQVQLLTARLTVHNERVTRATKELDAVHVELANVQRDAASFAADAAAIEEALGREADPTKIQLLKQQARGQKMHQHGKRSAVARPRSGLRECTGDRADSMGGTKPPIR